MTQPLWCALPIFSYVTEHLQINLMIHFLQQQNIVRAWHLGSSLCTNSLCIKLGSLQVVEGPKQQMQGTSTNDMSEREMGTFLCLCKTLKWEIGCFWCVVRRIYGFVPVIYIYRASPPSFKKEKL